MASSGRAVMTRGAHIFLQDVQQRFMRELFLEALGFGGAVIVRRLVGMAHTVDMDAIQPADARCASVVGSHSSRCIG